MCYHRGRESQGLYGFVWQFPPYNPRQALTHLEGTPDIYQYSGVAWGSHRPSDDVSLHIASHCFALVGHTERRPPMKSSLYGERDYAFGQAMLTLRTTIGLTQAGLANRLGVSRRAVAEWEAGSSYPKAERLKVLIALGVQQQAFADGREAEEIRALWKAAHQKVLLDEQWLHGLLGKHRPPLTLVAPQSIEQTRPGEQTRATDQAMPRHELGRRWDWAELRAGPTSYD